MTGLEIYLLVTPLVLAAAGLAIAYWWTVRSDREEKRAKQPDSR